MKYFFPFLQQFIDFLDKWTFQHRKKNQFDLVGPEISAFNQINRHYVTTTNRLISLLYRVAHNKFTQSFHD